MTCPTAISLFSGAGGMDVGFESAGFQVLWANDSSPDACETYRRNHGQECVRGDISELKASLSRFAGKTDLVFGGPPCQGFSIAGKMNPDDPRSRLLWEYLDVVSLAKPRLFVCENVKALASLEKWARVRSEFLRRAESMGYGCSHAVLNAKDFGVPQNRERVFFVGVRGQPPPNLPTLFAKHRAEPPSVREILLTAGTPGSESNGRVCNAKVVLATNPILRRSPYAGMLFNGLGRPLRLDGPSATLPASMGGNKTPIVDESLLRGSARDNWVEYYHRRLLEGHRPAPGEEAPKRLRRLTVDEAALIQTFPRDYDFAGSQSSVFRQIGNAVPCRLAEAVAKTCLELLDASTPVDNT
jgi:DNA (cytosine-5)-methyltransferase 1